MAFITQILEVVREVTGETNNVRAVEKFREKLNSSENYFNSEPFPKHESDEEAYHMKCSDIEGAKKYCPERWAAMQLWFSESRKVIAIKLSLPSDSSLERFSKDG